jgi:hypothetical protein
LLPSPSSAGGPGASPASLGVSVSVTAARGASSPMHNHGRTSPSSLLGSSAGRVPMPLLASPKTMYLGASPLQHMGAGGGNGTASAGAQLGGAEAVVAAVKRSRLATD